MSLGEDVLAKGLYDEAGYKINSRFEMKFVDMKSLIDYSYKNVDFVSRMLVKSIEDILKPFMDDEDFITFKLERYCLQIELYSNSKDCELFYLNYRTDNFYIDAFINVTKENAQAIKETLDNFFGIEGKMT